MGLGVGGREISSLWGGFYDFISRSKIIHWVLYAVWTHIASPKPLDDPT